MELKEAENIVRSYLLSQKPLARHTCEIFMDESLSSRPEPDESFDFPGGTVAVEYESGMPVMSVHKYWWLLHNSDIMAEGKKLAVVIIILDVDAAPRDQLARQKATAEQLQKDYPGFQCFFVDYKEATPDAISAALAKAFDVVKA